MPKLKSPHSRMIFVHSLLRAVGEGKLPLSEIYKNYIRLRPGNLISKMISRPADIRTVDVYLKTLTQHRYLGQEVAPLRDDWDVQIIHYFIQEKGRAFLASKK